MINSIEQLTISLYKDIKHFDKQLNLALGEGLTKQEKQTVYKEFGKLRKRN